MTRPVRIALLGAGVFAETAYLPLLTLDHADRVLVGVWSRKQESVHSIVQKAGDVTAWHGEDGLEQLLALPDLDAVLVVVAAQATLHVVRAALTAGKAVLSEKPAGPKTTEVAEMLAWMDEAGIPRSRWCVQENYRGESGLVHAAALAAGRLGAAIKVDLLAELPMTSASRYYTSDWRRELPGSFLLEGGVHFVSALRMLGSAAGTGEVAEVSALLRRCSPGVPEPDTLVGWGRFDSGALASFSITQAGSVPRLAVSVVGTKGTVEAKRGAWGGWSTAQAHGYTVHAEVVDGPFPGDCGPLPCPYPFDGVAVQIQRFIAGVAAARDGEELDDVATADARAVSVAEGAQDLSLMEALLASGAAGGKPTPVQRFV